MMICGEFVLYTPAHCILHETLMTNSVSKLKAILILVLFYYLYSSNPNWVVRVKMVLIPERLMPQFCLKPGIKAESLLTS